MVSTKFIKEVMVQFGITQKALGEKLGKPQPQISFMLKRDTIDSIEFINAIAELSGQSFYNLTKEVVYIPKEERVLYNVPKEKEGEYEMIELTNYRGAANTLLGYQNGVKEEGDYMVMPKFMLKAGVHTTLTVKGESMGPKMSDGTILICRILDKAEWEYLREKKVYAFTYNGETRIKRLASITGNILTLSSDNPDKRLYPDIKVEFEEITQIFEAEMTLSDDMENPIEDLTTELKNLKSNQHNTESTVERLYKELINLKKQIGKE